MEGLGQSGLKPEDPNYIATENKKTAIYKRLLMLIELFKINLILAIDYSI